jgi:hypothetical protein
LLLGGGHQAKEIARLLPVVVIDAMVIVGPVAIHRHRKLGKIGLVVPQPGAVSLTSPIRRVESA